MSKALATKGLIIEKVDPQKMNLWDLNHNLKYTEMSQSNHSKQEQPNIEIDQPKLDVVNPQPTQSI